MQKRRIALVSLLVLVLSGALLPLPAAQAATGIGGAGASIDTVGKNRVVASGMYVGQLLGTDELLVEFECNAESIGAAASTAITNCELIAGDGSHFAPDLALPGNAVATAGVATVPLAPIRLCWTATGTFVLGSPVTTSGCTALNL